MTIPISIPVNLAADPVGHVVNHLFPGVHDWSLSMHVGQLVLAGFLTVLLLWIAAAQIKTGPESLGVDRYVTKGKFAHMIEVICAYLRDQTVRPLLGDRTDALMPFLWTMFFFILINNLLGLIPILDLQHLLFPSLAASHSAYVGGTATQNIAVTGVLALIAFLVVNIAGIREMGVKHYFGHMTGGAPILVAPLIFLLELIGTFVKPVALAIRLFANMTAGHILMAVLFGFAGAGVSMLAKSPVLGGGITIASFLGAVAINLLELFVAFLQAFVFMFLTAVFISQLSHHHDEHEHHDAPGHEHAHA